MAKTLMITAADKDFEDTIEALCEQGGYTEDMGDKPAFAQGVLLAWLGDCRREKAQRALQHQIEELRQQFHQQIDEANASARESVKISVTDAAVSA